LEILKKENKTPFYYGMHLKIEEKPEQVQGWNKQVRKLCERVISG